MVYLDDCEEKGPKVYTKFYMISDIHCLQKSFVQLIKTLFFLDLAKSGQYLARTGPQLKKWSGRPEADIRSHND